MGVARELKDFDPFTTKDPVRDLTLAIRGLRMGDRIQLPDGTVVKSTVVRRGSCNERLFAVQPPVDKSTPEQRHKDVTLGRAAYRTAEEAAKKALER